MVAVKVSFNIHVYLSIFNGTEETNASHQLGDSDTGQTGLLQVSVLTLHQIQCILIQRDTFHHTLKY